MTDTTSLGALWAACTCPGEGPEFQFTTGTRPAWARWLRSLLRRCGFGVSR